MGNFLVKILLSCIGIGYAISVNAQDNITGRILDEQEQGLDAVVVMLASLPENVLIETAVTDSNGHFYFPVHKGEFLLCVRTLGYKEIKKNITIAGPQTLPDIQMEPDNISLQDVVVTARKSRPMATSSNGKIQIHIAQSYLTDIGNALDVLKHTPGVSKQQRRHFLSFTRRDSHIRQRKKAHAARRRALNLPPFSLFRENITNRNIS